MDKFRWSKSEGKSSQLFPIDYTVSEFADFLGEITQDTRKVKKIILKNSILGPVLRELLFTDINGVAPPEAKDMLSPLPLETGPFLKCFYKLATKPQYEKIFSGPLKVSSNDKIQGFIDDLCKTLFTEIESESSDSPVSIRKFYLHALFQNSKFVTVMLGSLWEDEIGPRFQKLRQLARQVSPEWQIRALVDCLAALDRNILNLTLQHTQEEDNRMEGSVKESRRQNDLQGLLRSLTGYRKKEYGTNSYATYKVDNCTLPNGQTLEQAFYDLTKPKKDPVLLENAQEAYLIDLEHMSNARKSESAKEAQKIEEKFLKVKEYLNLTSRQSEQAVAEIIQERCKMECLRQLESCLYDPLHEQTMNPENQSYNFDLIDHLVSVYIRQQLQDFYDLFQLVRFYHAAGFGSAIQDQYLKARLSLVEVASTFTNLYDIILNTVPYTVPDPTRNSYYSELLKLRDLLQRTWKFVCIDSDTKQPFSTNDDNSAFRKDAVVALLEASSTAAQFF